MATLRELLAERVVGLARRTADAVTGRLRAAIRPAKPTPPVAPRPVAPPRAVVPPRPTPTVAPVAPVTPVLRPVTPAQTVRTRPISAPTPPTPATPVERQAIERVRPDPARAAPGALLQELSSLQAATSSLVERLRELGYLDAAQAILGTPVAPKPPKEEKPPGLPPLPPEPPIEPPPQEQEEEPEEEEEKPEEYRPPRYLLNGPAIRIPWFPPEEAYSTFATVWDRISIGGKRDPTDPSRGLEGIARYGADAIARGSPMDPGKRIPLSALVSKRSFTTWAKQNGYEDGLSIIVDGLLPEGGKPIGPMDPRYATSSRERQKAAQQSEQKNVRNVAYWTPPLDGGKE